MSESAERSGSRKGKRVQNTPEAMSARPIVVTSESVEQTMRVGRAIASRLTASDVVALRGILGAGKTQLVRGIAEGLGVGEEPDEHGAIGGRAGGVGVVVASPTFVLMSEYEGRVPVVHIDAYRMTGLSDLESIGYEQEMLDGAVTLIEWAERIEDDLPADRFDITITHLGETERRLTIRGFGGATERLQAMGEAIERAMKPGKCPTCGANVLPFDVESPFCSKRCRMADLNRWFNGEYRVSRPLGPADDLE